KGPTGSNTNGGHIELESFNANVTGAAGSVLDATGDSGNGVIIMTGCAVNYAGTVTPSATLNSGLCPGGKPQLPANTDIHSELCALNGCGSKPLPPVCPEDPTANLTKTVDASKPQSGINYKTLQAAYDAAADNAGEIIGMFSKTTENVVLGGNKTL